MIQIKISGLPKSLTTIYAKKLQRQYRKMGIETVVIQSKWLQNSCILDNCIGNVTPIDS